MFSSCLPCIGFGGSENTPADDGLQLQRPNRDTRAIARDSARPVRSLSLNQQEDVGQNRRQPTPERREHFSPGSPDFLNGARLPPAPHLNVQPPQTPPAPAFATPSNVYARPPSPGNLQPSNQGLKIHRSNSASDNYTDVTDDAAPEPKFPHVDSFVASKRRMSVTDTGSGGMQKSHSGSDLPGMDGNRTPSPSMGAAGRRKSVKFMGDDGSVIFAGQTSPQGQGGSFVSQEMLDAALPFEMSVQRQKTGGLLGRSTWAPERLLIEAGNVFTIGKKDEKKHLFAVEQISAIAPERYPTERERAFQMRVSVNPSAAPGERRPSPSRQVVQHLFSLDSLADLNALMQRLENALRLAKARSGGGLQLPAEEGSTRRISPSLADPRRLLQHAPEEPRASPQRRASTPAKLRPGELPPGITPD